MIPMPPSHWVNWRHMATERGRASMSVSTVAPVVVKPDIASKYASNGLESCGTSARRYVRAPYEAAHSHVSATTRNPSRTPTDETSPVALSSAQPAPLVIAPAARNGHTGSE